MTKVVFLLLLFIMVPCIQSLECQEPVRFSRHLDAETYVQDISNMTMTLDLLPGHLLRDGFKSMKDFIPPLFIDIQRNKVFDSVPEIEKCDFFLRKKWLKKKTFSLANQRALCTSDMYRNIDPFRKPQLLIEHKCACKTVSGLGKIQCEDILMRLPVFRRVRCSSCGEFEYEKVWEDVSLGCRAVLNMEMDIEYTDATAKMDD